MPQQLIDLLERRPWTPKDPASKYLEDPAHPQVRGTAIRQ
jgi:hypothetical protein